MEKKAEDLQPLLMTTPIVTEVFPQIWLSDLLWTQCIVTPQVRAHQLVLPPCDVVIKAAADYVRDIPDITDLEAIAKDIFKHSQVGKVVDVSKCYWLLWKKLASHC